MAEDKNWRREYGSVHMKKERRYVMFVDISCIAELAVVYNVGVIFKKVIKLFSDANYVSWNECRLYRETLLELCCVFKRRNFQELLLEHECQELHKESTSEASTFALLYRLLIEYTLSRKQIKSIMEQLPNIHRLINAPFDENSNNYTMCPGLTPLQSYVFKFNVVDASIVRTMIDLGADIDKVFPPNLHAYNNSVGVFSREKCNTPGGKTLLMYVLSKGTEFQQGFRELLEVLLYENVKPTLNESVVASCLKRYKYQILPGGSGINIDTGYYMGAIKTDTYTMDSNVYESALFYTVPLLIETGFHYSLSDIDEVVHAEDDLEKVKKVLKQRVEDTRTPYHLERRANFYVSTYLKQCLTVPRSLKLRCRDILRNHFPRRQIHRFASNMEIPGKIKDFLLLKPILQTLYEDI